jgi:acyl-CoA reductase-like NAD-dependent aldehyde dehydrogenase
VVCSPHPAGARGAPLRLVVLCGGGGPARGPHGWAEAIAQANGTGYGLGSGIFTSDVAGAVQAMREIDSGTIHVNWTPLWRADLMPYGGLKGSGIGKEGPRSAVEEMTEVKTVVLHGRPW